MVDIKAIIEVLNGVEDSLKEQLKSSSSPHIESVCTAYSSTPQEHIANSLSSVQEAIAELLMLG